MNLKFSTTYAMDWESIISVLRGKEGDESLSTLQQLPIIMLSQSMINRFLYSLHFYVLPGFAHHLNCMWMYRESVYVQWYQVCESFSFQLISSFSKFLVQLSSSFNFNPYLALCADFKLSFFVFCQWSFTLLGYRKRGCIGVGQKLGFIYAYFYSMLILKYHKHQ